MHRNLFLSAIVLLVPAVVKACDLCGCYTPQLDAMVALPNPGFPSWLAGTYAGVGEQFTRFGTLQVDGNEVPNPTGQYLNSSITQIVGGYSITPRFALQVSLPLIYRDFKRPAGFTIDHGTVSGLGDVPFLLRSVVFQYASAAPRTFDVTGKNPVGIQQEPDLTMSVVLLSGVKFPTGDSSRLAEEFHEVDVPGAPVSGIHGHDLTLGTGSFDGIFGEQSSLRYKDWFVETNVQFTLRGDGSHQYHFANDLTWSGGPGYYFFRRPGTIVGLQFLVSGEHKDADRFRGYVADDTGITSIFLGPRMVASWHQFSAEGSVEIPVSIQNTALQAVPDYRIRAGVSIHF